MKNIINRIFTALAAAVMLFAASCEKVNYDDRELLLEVNASNLHGNWELRSINYEFVMDGSYFYINFDRSGEKFQIWENLTSIPSTFNHSEGTFKLYTDPELGVYIRGIDNVKEEWSDTYVIKELTRHQMVWVSMKDPTFIQVFTRIDTVPVQK